MMANAIITNPDSIPEKVKKDLAWSIVRDFHSAQAADHAAESWAQTFQQNRNVFEIELGRDCLRGRRQFAAQGK